MMDINLLAEKCKTALERNPQIFFDEPEVYYFALGYLLNSVFAELGGIDQHRSEFNYLTNPYIPADIQTISVRVMMFFKKIKCHPNFKNTNLISTLNAVISYENLLTKTNIHLRFCETAFYAGLYSTD